MHSLKFSNLPQSEWTKPELAELEALNRAIDTCTLCPDHGYQCYPRPIDRGAASKRLWLIGQAPGSTEGERHIAFAGQAGRKLMQWFAQVGLTEAEVRDYFYLSAVNKCYPGRASGGGGDRNPTPIERALCRPFLLQELTLIRPRLVILVGSNAIKEVYGEKVKLEEIIGQPQQMTLGELKTRLEVRLLKAGEPHPSKITPAPKNFDPATLVPVFHLPHPSGASTWLHFPQNKALLEQALDQLKERLAGLL
jgi:uracil-DNA glycosylase